MLKAIHLLSVETLRRLKTCLPGTKSSSTSADQRAKNLIEAIDAGGLPLNPARVNDIARQLGLEVSARAPMAQTIERIRKALQRS